LRVKPIKTESDYENALARVEQIFDARADTEESDELEILVTLIEIYESRHYAIEAPNPVEAIKFRMEQENLKQKDLITTLGSASRVSEVLNKKRKLTLEMIRNLHRDLKIPFENLFSDYSLNSI